MNAGEIEEEETEDGGLILITEEDEAIPLAALSAGASERVYLARFACAVRVG